MNAESIAVADKIVEILQGTFTTAGFGAANISREYDVKYDLGKIDGMQVPVFPTMYGDDVDLTRAETLFDVSGYIIVGERYKPAGKPTKDWMDARVNLVESAVFAPLSVVEWPLVTINDVQYWRKAIKIECVFDEVFYREQKVFWSEISYTLHKIRIR